MNARHMGEQFPEVGIHYEVGDYRQPLLLAPGRSS